MFFTHTRGYRIGTCVIGFVCTEKTAKAPAAIGGIYFLRGEYSITTISIVRRVVFFLRRRKSRKNSHNHRYNARGNVKNGKIWNCFRAPNRCSNVVYARLPGRRAHPVLAGITEHTLSSFRRRARARAHPRTPKKGRPEYFHYYYYYFITILLSFKFAALTPEKKYTHGTNTYTYIIILPTYLPTPRPIQPSAAQSRESARRRYSDSNGRVYALYYNIIWYRYTVACTYISRTALR